MSYYRKHRSGFSLIELVIVVVIIAIIAAIAIPKMSRGAQGAADAALMQDLAQMRSAIDLFTTEHSGTAPSTTVLTFTSQMTQYSDVTGTSFSTTKTSTCIYGPYLKAIPAQPVGSYKGSTTVAMTSGSTSAGWYYDGTTMWANAASTDKDASGTLYTSY